MTRLGWRLLAAALRVETRRTMRVGRVAGALGVSFSAARQLLDGEVPVRRRTFRQPGSLVDRWRFEARRGVRP